MRRAVHKKQILTNDIEERISQTRILCVEIFQPEPIRPWYKRATGSAGAAKKSWAILSLSAAVRSEANRLFGDDYRIEIWSSAICLGYRDGVIALPQQQLDDDRSNDAIVPRAAAGRRKVDMLGRYVVCANLCRPSGVA